MSSQKRCAPSSDAGDDSAARSNGHSNDCKKPKSVNPKKKRKHHDPLILETRRQIQACCARDDLAHAMIVFHEAMRGAVQTTGDPVEGHLGNVLEPQTLYNLLSLCCGLSDRGLHIGTPVNRTSGSGGSSKPTEATQHDSVASDASPGVPFVDTETRQAHADTIMEHMRERNIPLTESCYTCMVKLFSRTSVDKAEALLDEAERTQQCGRRRLRMYSPLLLRYCELGQLLSACRVWKRVTANALTLSEREYTALMRCSCQTGCSALTERILIEMSEEVRVPSRDFRLAVIDWFRTPSGLSTESSSLDQAEVVSLLQQIPRPYPFAVESMGPVVNAEATSYQVSENCRVNSKGMLQSGCLAGSRLQPAVTLPSLWEELKRMNETIVIGGRVSGDQSEFQGGRKGPKKSLDEAALERRRREWEDFGRHLEGPNSAIDVIVDGANVGYYEANYAGAPKHVDYQQIDWIVQHFVKKKKKVLVFLNARHVSRPLMPPNAEPLVASWRAMNVLYTTPRGMNDDWFWLHAALVKRSLVVTNDEMRDHHFQMLAQRGFLRWKDSHQVHFSFGAWEEEDGRRRRSVELTYPDTYSRRIQCVGDGLVIPMPKRGDENRFLDGFHHADDSSPVEETYLCIRPNLSSA